LQYGADAVKPQWEREHRAQAVNYFLARQQLDLQMRIQETGQFFADSLAAIHSHMRQQMHIVQGGGIEAAAGLLGPHPQLQTDFGLQQEIMESSELAQ
jgi:hypothetical protein